MNICAHIVLSMYILYWDKEFKAGNLRGVMAEFKNEKIKEKLEDKVFADFGDVDWRFLNTDLPNNGHVIEFKYEVRNSKKILVQFYDGEKTGEYVWSKKDGSYIDLNGVNKKMKYN